MTPYSAFSLESMTYDFGENVFYAVGRMFGHLASDINAPSASGNRLSQRGSFERKELARLENTVNELDKLEHDVEFLPI